MRAVVLAGGQGTRLRPLTDARPKPLVAFLGEPYAVGLLRRLRAVGCDDVTFLIAQDPAPYEVLREAAADLGVTVAALTEERPLDTAGAARRLLRDHTSGPVLVCNGDVLSDLDLGGLLDRHAEARACATIALTRVEDTSAFGVVVCAPGTGVVRAFVEKPPPGTLADDTVNAGTYVLSPGALSLFPGDGPLSFERHVFPGLLEAGNTVLGVVHDGYWQDLGTPARYLDGQRAVLDGRCRWPVGDGLQPVGDRSLVHRDAEVAADVHLGPYAVVSAGCRVATGAALRDCALHAGVTVGRGAHVHGAIIGPGARIADGVTVGPGAVVADGAAVAG